MEDFTFDELVEIVKEVYGGFRRGAFRIGENDNHSLERFFNDYRNIIERGISESTIIYSTLCIELKNYEVKSLSERQFKRLSESLERFNFDEVSEVLTIEQANLLMKSVISSKEYLENVQIV